MQVSKDYSAMKLRVIILRNESEEDHLPWIIACEAYREKVSARIVNLTSARWLEDIQAEPCDVLLAKPGGLTSLFKQLYDERIYILSRYLGYTVFPSPEEIFIYENKRMLSYWLKANGVPHPATTVIYRMDEALEFLSGTVYPVVAKTNIGASGSGVSVLHDTDAAIRYAEATFRGKGAPQRSGPNLEKGGYLVRGMHYLKHPTDIAGKLKIYRTRATSLQKGFVIFQEYIDHGFEWRAVRIGESYFAHKKMKAGEKASGSLLKNYDNPPLGLLDFVREITDKHGFRSQAVDIFESNRGYLVNEMQCIFGQSDSFQMLVDGIPGRYVHEERGWTFQKGDFAINECYNLRLMYLIDNHESSLRM